MAVRLPLPLPLYRRWSRYPPAPPLHLYHPSASAGTKLLVVNPRTYMHNVGLSYIVGWSVGRSSTSHPYPHRTHKTVSLFWRELYVRMLRKLWFSYSHYHEAQYIGRVTSAQLMKQHPPSAFSHPPCSIAKHLNYWKASELRRWLLYYSLALLLHHLPLPSSTSMPGSCAPCISCCRVTWPRQS